MKITEGSRMLPYSSNTENKNGKNAKTGENGFSEALNRAVGAYKEENAAGLFSESCGNKSVSEELSMLEYEDHIYGIISKMPKCNKRMREDTVIISDEGFKAMKSDPEYEKWVLDRIRASFGSGGFLYGKRDKIYNVMFIGADKDEFRSESLGGELSYPSAEELRRFRMQRKLKAEKLARYRKALEESSIKKADKELDHIKGIYKDYLYAQKNISAVVNMHRYFLQS